MQCAYLCYLSQNKKEKCNVLHIIQAKFSTFPKSEVQNSQRKSNNQISVCFHVKPCVGQKAWK